MFTLKQTIDAATRDFLKPGINCIQYNDGRRVNIASYAEMAERTVNYSRDKEMYNRYKRVLGDELIPDLLDKIQQMKYNDVDTWKTIKSKYRIVNQYQNHTDKKMDSKTIIQLHKEAYDTKRNLFSSKFKTSGNIGIMELDGEIY